MAARDIFHKAVKQALQEDGWSITRDPLSFKFGDVNFQVDLAAERLFAAEKSGEKIAVEIKTFLVIAQLRQNAGFSHFSVIF